MLLKVNPYYQLYVKSETEKPLFLLLEDRNTANFRNVVQATFLKNKIDNAHRKYFSDEYNTSYISCILDTIFSRMWETEVTCPKQPIT